MKIGMLIFQGKTWLENSRRFPELKSTLSLDDFLGVKNLIRIIEDELSLTVEVIDDTTDIYNYDVLILFVSDIDELPRKFKDFSYRCICLNVGKWSREINYEFPLIMHSKDFKLRTSSVLLKESVMNEKYNVNLGGPFFLKLNGYKYVTTSKSERYSIVLMYLQNRMLEYRSS